MLLDFFMCSMLFLILLHITSFLCMCVLLGLLSTSGDNFMSAASLEIYLLRIMLTCSIHILPAVCGWILTWETTEEALYHWRRVVMDYDSYYKHLNAGFVSSPDDNWWTGVLWCFYSDGTHSLPLLRHISPNLMKTHSSWSWRLVHFWGGELFLQIILFIREILSAMKSSRVVSISLVVR